MMMSDDSDVDGLRRERDELRDQVQQYEILRGAHPLGHFYSPLPSREEIEARINRLDADAAQANLSGIELDVDRQLSNLAAMTTAIAGFVPFPETRNDDFRFYFDNTQYSYNDAITLYAMLRVLRPKRIVEIGSGFSSAVMLDTNERFLGNEASCAFIEPYPDRLDLLLRNDDVDRHRIFRAKVQDVDVRIFQTLERGDILFIDSSHVVKVGSDVEYIFRTVLPALRDGVYVHFHDIFYPFEYPDAWSRGGHYWNECYMLRAFLSFNAAYRIEFFTDYIARFHRDRLGGLSPLCLVNTGANFWMSKNPPRTGTNR